MNKFKINEDAVFWRYWQVLILLVSMDLTNLNDQESDLVLNETYSLGPKIES